MLWVVSPVFHKYPYPDCAVIVAESLAHIVVAEAVNEVFGLEYNVVPYVAVVSTQPSTVVTTA
jgi:hypothetical protein